MPRIRGARLVVPSWETEGLENTPCAAYSWGESISGCVARLARDIDDEILRNIADTAARTGRATYTQEAMQAAESAYQELDRVTSAWAYRAVNPPYVLKPESTRIKKKLSAFSILVAKEKEINSKS